MMKAKKSCHNNSKKVTMKKKSMTDLQQLRKNKDRAKTKKRLNDDSDCCVAAAL